MPESSNLANLPLDILVLIFPYLDAESFLSLCSTCKDLHQDNIRLDPTFWSHATRTTFRIPNRPIVQSNGRRWQRLYRRLLTQSRVFTWGSNTNGCLGHSYDKVAPTVWGRGGDPPRMRRLMLRDSVSWPKEMENSRNIGIIADLQCGGWSTTLLNSKGILYNVGTLDGGNRAWTDPILSPLKFPSGFPRPTERYDPYVAIRQFSSGRSHILGVADSGTIWSWYDKPKAGLHIKFLHHDVVESGSADSSSRRHGHVRRVVAGWNKSSAYITGIGIVLWEPVSLEAQAAGVELDTMLINETAVVPKASYLRPRRSHRDIDSATHQLGEEVGEVTSFIILENYVLFVTDLCRLFCAKVTFNVDFLDVANILELLPLQRTSTEDSTPCITDIHGSFRSFAVLKSTGEVLTVKQQYLDACWDIAFSGTLALGSLDEHAPFRGHIHRISALQNAGVIAMAFGDYHFHALHASGAITSYGVEPQGCGALGLGQCAPSESEVSEGMLRGIRSQGFARDGKLLPHAYARGRQVWFQPEKRVWLEFLAAGGKYPSTALARGRTPVSGPPDIITRAQNMQGEVSEWIEQRGRAWDKRPEIREEDEDGLGAYFALSVAAAGWHSGALVLVNEELVKKIGYRYVWAHDLFPRLRLSNGIEMPGSGPFDEWGEEGRPEWDENFTI
ncbi:hypothetical protein NA57DRAFT_30831 [Rhizodiscina lignyota]|uniref:F-box domain-containing protein n=1 Tax=Rhizodiscina lignyota TaxID=1504668 RepID=A0A9P4IS10_9PEZI|nr:hypothetical protein NA57DRAFT_30831 [Rhizodiscina lignyota]